MNNLRVNLKEIKMTEKKNNIKCPHCKGTGILDPNIKTGFYTFSHRDVKSRHFQVSKTIMGKIVWKELIKAEDGTRGYIKINPDSILDYYKKEVGSLSISLRTEGKKEKYNPIISTSKQPTQTNENLKESISSVQQKIDVRGKSLPICGGSYRR